ncbi:hypothetical protein B0T11DRAFT_287507 [Plectosphaerella cucumerina]|uniref:Uncharacterized protein n=1 Tax=Plectosphaerella cucumerina TaxID=40658 RepID=A0A8K0T8K0_9PEZI|nr:hypothetical protein B0T11DRAFT_287507 [Plectosphaerella cucumerina]
MYFHIRNPGANQANIVGTYGDGRPIEEGEYRILARTLRNYGDRSNLDHWQWKISPRIEVYTPEPVPEPSVTPTSTSEPPTSTPTLGPAPPIATCGSSVPVHLTARIGLTDQIIPLVLYSEFLGVDITDSETPLEFALTTEGFLKTRSPTSPHVELFAAAASIQDSLIYLYPESRITGVFSRVQFETKCGGGRLSAASDAKSKLYVCELEWEKHMPLRFTDVIPEGEHCERVSLLLEELPLECEDTIIEVPPAV